LTAPHAGLHAIRVTTPPSAPSDEGVVSSDTTGRAFASFDLPDPVMAGIRNAGFTHCTPIQEKVLPLSLAGRDVAGQAQTGTGKTAAFLITLFTRLLANERPGRPAAPRALIIAPTRELAVQIAADAHLLGSETPFRIHAVYGGIDYRKQRAAFEQGVDVLIGTPGRLIDYLKQHVYDLRSVETLVIDEADRMFDMGFIADLRFLLRRLPVEKRQSLLFSATLNFDVMELAYVFMNDAVRVAVTPEQVTAEKVEHLVYHVSKDEKLRMLVGLLKPLRESRVLVFVNMRRSADRVERVLQANGIGAAAITGDVEQRKRLAILADFKEGRLPVLVATDVASRGLHIEAVTHVINYDLPHDAEDYVHRVGRTARAGASGHAISLACEDYVEGLEAIEKYVGFKLPHDFPDDAMLAQHIAMPPREHHDRRHGHGAGRSDRRGDRSHGRSSGGPPRSHGHQQHAHAPRPAPPPGGATPAPATGAADGTGKPRRKRRRRRGRRGGPKPTPAQ
jgi:ATP-dependent RNA helicase RhlB